MNDPFQKDTVEILPGRRVSAQLTELSPCTLSPAPLALLFGLKLSRRAARDKKPREQQMLGTMVPVLKEVLNNRQEKPKIRSDMGNKRNRQEREPGEAAGAGKRSPTLTVQGWGGCQGCFIPKLGTENGTRVGQLRLWRGQSPGRRRACGRAREERACGAPRDRKDVLARAGEVGPNLPGPQGPGTELRQWGTVLVSSGYRNKIPQAP